MRRILQLKSWLALAGTIVPSVLYYENQMELSTVKTVMLFATYVWFDATLLWMGRDQPKDQTVTLDEAPSGTI
ncbi:MAG: hypothetical protein ACC645_25565 [Pirellulales bacterium]